MEDEFDYKLLLERIGIRCESRGKSMEKEIDYKQAFKALFEWAERNRNFENGTFALFLRSKAIPIEYCRGILNGDKMTENEFVSIICRKDFPQDEIINACKDALLKNPYWSEGNLMGKICEQTQLEQKNLPEKFYEWLFERNEHNLSALTSDTRISDAIKRRLMKRIIPIRKGDKLDSERVTDHDVYLICNFFETQMTIPDDCWPLVDALCKYLKNGGLLPTHGLYGALLQTKGGKKYFFDLIDYMRVPLEDSLMERLVNDTEYTEKKKWTLALKAANNVSVSDYGIMMILTTVNDKDVLEPMNELIDVTKGKRDEYRRNHGIEI